MTSLYEAPAGPVRGAFSGARRALIEFAERDPVTQSDIDRVMRALASHDGWYVPMKYAGHVWGQSHFEHSLIFPEPIAPNPALLVFSDLDAAQMVEGEALGMYGGPVPGTRLLSGLSGVEALVVNHGSPREQQWYIGAVGFQVAGGWSSAIAVERALAERGNGPAPAAALLGHTYQLLLEQATRSLAQIYLPDIDGAVAVAFTASDRAEEFVSCLPREARPLADLAPLPGHQLFEMMRSVGAAGLVINAGSDDQTALTREDITEILSS